MRFPALSLDQLLGELTEIESDWQDETSAEVIGSVGGVIESLRAAESPDARSIAEILRRYPYALDVFRLLRSQSQEAFIDDVRAAAGGGPRGIASWRARARRDSEEIARALLELGVGDDIRAQLDRAWTVDDVLVERYRYGRGRAIAGQARGRGLEDVVQTILESVNAPFDRGVTFTGVAGVRAKADFALPSRTNVKVVIEVKAFEATGSKQTDVLGDIRKIGEAKGSQRYFFIVTDGRGWLRRESDLRQILDLHAKEVVDNIYTRARLSTLAADIAHILEHEL